MTQLDDAKYRIAKDMFLRTADDNYLVARWCRFQGFNADFSWLAVHAVEKYLKAALLMNGYSSKCGDDKKPYKHDIQALYRDVKAKVAKGLLDMTFTKPPNLGGFWREETTEEFIERLYGLGNEHNRYQVYGYEIEPEHLVKLDATVFAVRRLCQRLDLSIHPDLPAVTNRQILMRQPGYWNLGERLERAALRKDDKMHDVLCRLNLAFAPASYEQPNGSTGASKSRSALYKEIFRPSYDDREDVEHLDALVKWITENIVLNAEAVQELKNKVKKETDAYERRSRKSPPKNPPGQPLALVLGQDDARRPPPDVGVDEVAEMGVVAASVSDVAPDAPVPEEMGPEEFTAPVLGTEVRRDRDDADSVLLGGFPIPGEGRG